MNGIRYVMARMLASAGFNFKTKRLTEAADESHLLKQAEEILGIDLWEKCEKVEGVNVEYWSLRQLKKKKEALELSLDEAHGELASCQEQRHEIIEQTNEECLQREDLYEGLKFDLENLINDRDEVVSKAHIVRRNIEASKTKMKVLEGQGALVDEEKLLNDYLKTFDELKESRNKVAAEIRALNSKMETLELQIKNDRKELKNAASKAFQSIGKVNRDASQISSEIGFIDLEMQGHYIKIGHYISQNVDTDSECKDVCKRDMAMVNQMKGLRQSILRNQRIASMVGHG